MTIRIPFLMVAFLLFAGCRVKQSGGTLARGVSSPPLVAEGWLNGTAPSQSDLAGKVILVDVWAYW